MSGLALDLLAVALALAWAVFAGVMALAWVAQQRTGNSGWVDVSWTVGLAAGALAGFFLSSADGSTARTVLVSAMVAVWAGRLGLYLAARTRGITDDPRYARMRAEWGEDAPRKMFWLLQLQALLSLPMVLTVIIAAGNTGPFPSLLDGLGIALFGAALVGSALSDRQLARFKQDPANRGKVCDAGLWGWSRHPNYLFEVMIWSAYVPVALAPDAGEAWGYVALAGPIAMFVLLRFVSGVPPLEAHMIERYGKAYAAYQRRTSTFFPRPPRPGAAAHD